MEIGSGQYKPKRGLSGKGWGGHIQGGLEAEKAAEKDRVSQLQLSKGSGANESMTQPLSRESWDTVVDVNYCSQLSTLSSL